MDIVTYLHKNGYKCSNWALVFASYNGHIEVVKYLIENIKVPCTQTAINWAKESEEIEIFQYLNNQKIIDNSWWW